MRRKLRNSANFGHFLRIWGRSADKKKCREKKMEEFGGNYKRVPVSESSKVVNGYQIFSRTWIDDLSKKRFQELLTCAPLSLSLSDSCLCQTGEFFFIFSLATNHQRIFFIYCYFCLFGCHVSNWNLWDGDGFVFNTIVIFCPFICRFFLSSLIGYPYQTILLLAFKVTKNKPSFIRPFCH